MFNAVLFDMDGVLLDSEPLHMRAERFACRAFGFDPPEETWERLKGRTAQDVFAELKRVCGRDEDPEVAALIAEKEAEYPHQLAGAQPLHLAMTCVEGSRAIFGKTALVTSSSAHIQQATLAALGMERKFHAIVTGDEITNGKPHPEPYLLAAAKLGVDPKDCAVVEDSDNGIRSAAAAGCFPIGITTSFPRATLFAAGAAIVCESHFEIICFLRSVKPAHRPRRAP